MTALPQDTTHTHYTHSTYTHIHTHIVIHRCTLPCAPFYVYAQPVSWFQILLQQPCVSSTKQPHPGHFCLPPSYYFRIRFLFSSSAPTSPFGSVAHFLSHGSSLVQRPWLFPLKSTRGPRDSLTLPNTPPFLVPTP